MKNLKIILVLLFFIGTINAQTVPGTLYIKVINSNGIPTKVNNQWVFSDPSLQTIFNSYGLTDFARGFPAIDQFPKHLKFGLVEIPVSQTPLFRKKMDPSDFCLLIHKYRPYRSF